MGFARKLIYGLGLSLVAFLSASAAPAQFAFRITFSDKLGAPQLSSQPAWLSSRAMARRAHFNISLDSTDRPVSPIYVDSVLRMSGGVLHITSRWLNNCVILVEDTAGIDSIRTRSFVRSAEWVGYFGNGLHQRQTQSGPALPFDPPPKETGTPSYYGNTWAQTDMVHGDALHDRGFKGAGKLIVVMDSGFPWVDTHPGFVDLNSDGRLLETYNIRQKDSNVFYGSLHGTQCLSGIAGFDTGKFVGSAPEAEIALYATEDASITDAIYELDNLIAGMERADSIGADVICASVVYNIFFSPFNYAFTKAELDGSATIVSRAANMAVSKGIFYVSSVGNEGGNSWDYLDSPGDADSALSIGSVGTNGVASAFSSPGPNASGRVKPDLCFLGAPAAVFAGGNGYTYISGTSFAAPQAAGFVACMLQAFPNSSLYEIRQAIIRSADGYTNPTSKRGYGIPDFRKAFSSLGIEKNYSAQQLRIHPNPFGSWLVLTIPNQATVAECSLIDMMGRNIPVNMQRSGNQLRIEPLNNLPPGAYLLHADIDGRRSSARVIRW